MTDEARTKAWEELCKETGLVDLNGDLELIHKRGYDAALRTAEENEEAVIQEAFMIGRIYATSGEKEGPTEIQEKLRQKCNDIKRLREAKEWNH